MELIKVNTKTTKISGSLVVKMHGQNGYGTYLGYQAYESIPCSDNVATCPMGKLYLKNVCLPDDALVRSEADKTLLIVYQTDKHGFSLSMIQSSEISKYLPWTS